MSSKLFDSALAGNSKDTFEEISLAEAVAESQRKQAELQLRMRQQAVIAEFGQHALAGTNLSTMMNEAVTLIAQTLDVEYSEILELLPGGHALLLRAGVGWQVGYVGQAMVGTETNSQAGYTLLSNEAVIVEDLRTETRFHGPPLLHEHGVISGMSVIIRGQERPFGVLGAHTTRQRTFTQDDIHFLEAVANILALAIERKRAEEALHLREQELTDFFENAPLGLHWVGADGTVLWVNRAELDLLGYTREEYIGHHIAEFHADREVIDDILHRLAQAETLHNYEARMRCKDGTIKYVLISSNGLWKDSKFIHSRCFTRDITERKQAEEALLRSVQELELAYQQSVIYAKELRAEITERRQAQVALQRREQEFRSLAENAPDIIIRFDRQLRHLYINQRIEAKTGLPLAAFLGRTNRELGMPEQLVDYWDEKLNYVFTTGQEATLEFEFPTPAGPGYFEARIIPEIDPNGSIETVLVISRDITKRKQAEEEVRRHTARNEALAEVSQALAKSGLDTQAVMDTITRYAAKVIGDACVIALISSDERWLKPVAFHHPAPKVKALLGPMLTSTPAPTDNRWAATLLRTGRPLLIPVVSHEQIRQMIEPEYWPYLEQVGIHSLLVVPLRVEGRVIGTLGLTRDQPGHPYTPDDQVFLQNLADRAALTIQNAQLFEQVQGAHERLRALSRRLLEVQEAERRHIARELHDEVGQVLTGLNLLLGMSTHLPAEEARANLAEAQALVSELMQQVDELSLDLRPPMLDDLGLLPTLLWHFERYTQQTKVQVAFKHAGLKGRRFASEVEITAYRLVQEALTNVARHASVAEATVRLWVNQNRLDLQVEDQGIGFEPQIALAVGASSGLSGMRERVSLLGGQLMIESSPGAGTSLIAELPLRREDKR